MIKKHASSIVAMILFLMLSVFFFSPWLKVNNADSIPSFEEGLLDVSAVQYSVNYLRNNGRLPSIWENRTYSQPMDEQYYQTTLVEIVPTAISYIFNIEPIYAVSIYYVLATALVLFVFYKILRLFNLGFFISILSSMIFFATDSFSLLGASQGEVRFLGTMIGAIISIFSLLSIVLRKSKNNIGYVILGLVGIALTSQANMLSIPLVILTTAFLAFTLRTLAPSRFKFKTKYFIIALSIIIVGAIPALINIKKAIDDNPVPVVSGHYVNEEPNIFSGIGFSLGSPNRATIITQQPITHIPNTIICVSIFLLIIINAALDKKIFWPFITLIFFLLIMSGINGPARDIINHISFLRSSGRLIFPFFHIYAVTIFAICYENIFVRVKNNSRLKSLAKPLLACLLLLASISAIAEEKAQVVRTRKIEKGLTEAYEQIPAGSLVMLLPQGLGLSPYSANLSNYALYRNDFAVGFSLSHQHEYLSERQNIKNIGTPPNEWTIPSNTKSIVDYYDWLISAKDWDRFNRYTNFLSPEMDYIIIYNKIINKDVAKELVNHGWINSYKNDLVTILKKDQDNKDESQSFNTGFSTFSDQYYAGIDSVSSLNKEMGIDGLFFNSDKTNLSETENLFDMPLALNNYDLENAKNDLAYYKSNNIASLSTSGECEQTSQNQPSIAKITTKISHDCHIIINKDRKAKSVYLRIFTKDIKSFDQIDIRDSDDKQVKFSKIGSNFNFTWINVPLNKKNISISASNDSYNFVDVAFFPRNETDEATIKDDIFEKQIKRHGLVYIIEPEDQILPDGSSIKTKSDYSRGRAINLDSELKIDLSKIKLSKKNIDLRIFANSKAVSANETIIIKGGYNEDTITQTTINNFNVPENGIITIRSDGESILDKIIISTPLPDNLPTCENGIKNSPASYTTKCSSRRYVLIRKSFSKNWQTSSGSSIMANFFQNGFIIDNYLEHIVYKTTPNIFKETKNKDKNILR